MHDRFLECCEDGTLRGLSRRTLLAGGAAFAAWAYLPKFAHAADGRDPHLITIILRGALDGIATVAPVADPDYAGLHGSIALALEGPHPAIALDSFFALHPSMPEFARMYKNGNAAVIHATATAYRDRSHFDGQDVLESGFAGGGFCFGVCAVVEEKLNGFGGVAADGGFVEGICAKARGDGVGIAAVGEEPFDASLPRIKAVGPVFRDWMILLGAILVVAVIVLLWIVASARARRRKARREERLQRRRTLKRQANAEPLPKVESADGRRRRRRKHRPRNPTLAETGGLPPVRDDDQLPQIPPH